MQIEIGTKLIEILNHRHVMTVVKIEKDASEAGADEIHMEDEFTGGKAHGSRAGLGSFYRKEAA